MGGRRLPLSAYGLQGFFIEWRWVLLAGTGMCWTLGPVSELQPEGWQTVGSLNSVG